jgi:hypothetical protein
MYCFLLVGAIKLRMTIAMCTFEQGLPKQLPTNLFGIFKNSSDVSCGDV